MYTAAICSRNRMVVKAVQTAAQQPREREARPAIATASRERRPRAKPVRMVAAVPMDMGTMKTSELKFRAT